MYQFSISKMLRYLACVLVISWLAGCASPQAARDYSAYHAANPRSILVLPPLNDSPEIQATPSVLAQATLPLAEAGYYVVPVTLMTETFRQNGLEIPADIHEVPFAKLHEIFAADTALYMRILKYGASYQVIDSVVQVSVQGRLVDLRTGTELWSGTAHASNKEGGNNSGGGLIGMLVTAVVNQVINSTTDASHPIAGTATHRLLAVGGANGLLYGPRSPLYQPAAR